MVNKIQCPDGTILAVMQAHGCSKETGAGAGERAVKTENDP